MYSHSQGHRNATSALQRRPFCEGTLFHRPLSTVDAKRSIKNIRQWNSFLPTGCVRAMVRMGWDYTT
jgi:hypothetical protein